MVDLDKIADSVSEISDKNADNLSNVSDNLSIPYIENGKERNLNGNEPRARAREGNYSQRNFCWKQSTRASSIEPLSLTRQMGSLFTAQCREK